MAPCRFAQGTAWLGKRSNHGGERTGAGIEPEGGQMFAWYWLVLAAMAGGSLGVLSMAIVVGGSRGGRFEEGDYAASVHWKPTVLSTSSRS